MPSEKNITELNYFAILILNAHRFSGLAPIGSGSLNLGKARLFVRARSVFLHTRAREQKRQRSTNSKCEEYMRFT